MRATSILRRLAGLPQSVVRGFSFEPEGLVLQVRPTWRRSRCSRCGRRAPRVDRLSGRRRWRHLGFGATRVLFQCETWRVRCRRCGLRVEKVPWSARPRLGFTDPFCQLVAFLAQRMSHAAVAEMLEIRWPTAGKIARAVAEDLLPDDRLDHLTRIGVDELCWQRPRGFLTVVWDHDRRRVVWLGEGKSAETLERFFDELGAERSARLEVVTGDMSGAYLAAIAKRVPQATLVLDPFHVLRLAHDAVDQVRRRVVRELRGEDLPAARAVKRSRYALLRHGARLDARESDKLEEIARTCQPLHRAWTLKEMLGHILELRSAGLARRYLQELIARMARSRLAPFVRLGRTLRQHAEAIVASIEHCLSNGPVEGCARKIRGLLFRAFGYREFDNLVAAIFLNCGDVHVPNPLSRPFKP